MDKTELPVSPALLSTPDQDAFRREIEQWHMAPLWDIYRAVLTREPKLREIPYMWRWQTVRPHLLRAGELIGALEAERRVLMYVNPGAMPINGARLGATATIYAAAQLILPGETARAHRHSPAALRFVIEGRGAYTSVEGEKISMEPGDLILTPSGQWHDHGNEGAEPVMWMDALDIPFTGFLNSMFLEDGAELHQKITVPEKHSEMLYGRALFPSGSGDEHQSQAGKPSPVLAYRWEAARQALELQACRHAPDPFDGHLLRYANPASGGEVLPTMGCRIQLLPKGFHSRAHRHTISTVYHVAEGSGWSVINGTRFDWQKGDTIALPAWCWHEHATEAGDAVLFSVTDEPILKPFGLIRAQEFAEDAHQPVDAVFVEAAN
jgi:gentisate 1,2-dioxygenase